VPLPDTEAGGLTATLATDGEAKHPAQQSRPMIDITQRLQDILRQLAEIARECRGAAASMPDGLAMGQLQQTWWTVNRMLNGSGPYFSQSGQDEYLDRVVFNRARDGIFVEVGAYDGLDGSNTLFFEMCRGWRGLLVEASPDLQQIASSRRRSPCVAIAVAPEAGFAEFLQVMRGYLQMSGLARHMSADQLRDIEMAGNSETRTIRVPTRPLADLLIEHGLRQVDYLSIDVEGAEQAILEAFPFDSFDIKAWSVEVRAGSDEIAEIMQRAGYIRTAFIGQDQIFVHQVLAAERSLTALAIAETTPSRSPRVD
jgi:FkbM family methyltransferase